MRELSCAQHCSPIDISLPFLYIRTMDRFETKYSFDSNIQTTLHAKRANSFNPYSQNREILKYASRLSCY